MKLPKDMSKIVGAAILSFLLLASIVNVSSINIVNKPIYIEDDPPQNPTRSYTKWNNASYTLKATRI